MIIDFFPIKNHFKIFKKRIKSYFLYSKMHIPRWPLLLCSYYTWSAKHLSIKNVLFFKDSIHVSLLFLSIKSFSLFSKMSFEGKINLCAFVKCSLKVVYINHITIFFFLPISKSYIIIFCCNCFCYIICKSNEIVNLFNNCFE